MCCPERGGEEPPPSFPQQEQGRENTAFSVNNNFQYFEFKNKCDVVLFKKLLPPAAVAQIFNCTVN